MPVAGPERSERDRICGALVGLIAERDYESLALEVLLRRAGVSRSAFHRHFDDLQHCFAAVWDQIDAEIASEIAAAYAGDGDWQDRLRRAFRVGLRYLARHPARARLYLTEAFRVDEDLRRRQYDSITRLSRIIDRGREGAPSEEPLPFAISEAISAAIWKRTSELVRAGRGAELPGQLHELMYFAVLPYRGIDAAEAELRLA